MNLEQMECVNQGRSDYEKMASKVCGGIFYEVGVGLGALTTTYTAGAVGWAMWGLGAWLGGIGLAVC